MRTAITTEAAPKAIGPYSQAIRAGQLLFISGQVPLDPDTGQMIQGDIRAQVTRVLENIGGVLKAAGLSFDHVVKTTVFLADMNDLTVMNDVYGGYFRDPGPARSTVQVARLPRDARIEVEAIASL